MKPMTMEDLTGDKENTNPNPNIMKKELKKIIDKANEDNLRLEEKVENLRSKVRFCTDHKFEEEKRIALLELNAIDMPAYRQRKTIEDLQALLTDMQAVP